MLKTFIKQEITRNVHKIRIDQLAFIKDLFLKKQLINSNNNIILMRTKLVIKILDLDDYKKPNFYRY